MKEKFIHIYLSKFTRQVNAKLENGQIHTIPIEPMTENNLEHALNILNKEVVRFKKKYPNIEIYSYIFIRLGLFTNAYGMVSTDSKIVTCDEVGLAL